MPPKRVNLLDVNIILISSKEQFDAIQKDKRKKNKKLVLKNQKKNIQQNSTPNEEIIIPRWGKVLKSEQCKSQMSLGSCKIQKSGYFRLRLQNNLPNPFAYEVTEQDYAVLNIFKQNYVYQEPMNFKLEEKHLIQVFKFCEQIQYSSDTQISNQINNQVWISSSIVNLIGNDFNQKDKHLLRDLIIKLVHYWKVVRKERNNLPLIRKYQSKQETSGYIQNIFKPFKHRYPFILDPKPVFYQLKAIGVKTIKQPEQIKIIQSFESWRQLMSTHKARWRQFQKCVLNFHSLSEIYGFIPEYKLNKNKSHQNDKKLKDKKNVEQNNLSMNQSRIQIRSLKSKKYQQTKPYNFKSVNEWIRFQKKTIRKSKMNESLSYYVEKDLQQAAQVIQIPDDNLYENQDISIQNKTSFIQNMLVGVQQYLQKHTAFNFIVRQDNEQVKQSGSQEFQSDLPDSFSQNQENENEQFQKRFVQETIKTNKEKDISNFSCYYDSIQTTFSQSDNLKSQRVNN